jgi:hypothetical protein
MKEAIMNEATIDRSATTHPIDTVKSCLRAVEAGDLARYESLLHDSWQMSVNGQPVPVDKRMYLGMLGALRRALPDMAIRPLDIALDGEWVTLTTSIVGTHSEPFEMPGMQAVPATRRRIEQPRQRARFRLVSGLIVEEQIETPPGVDPASVYTQMGVVFS